MSNPKGFNIWLKERLSKPCEYKQYDPNGNSPRAIASRGVFKEIVYQFKDYPSSFIYDVKCFKGFDTPIGYFIGIPIKVVLSPILPIFWGIYSHKKAIEEYIIMYNDAKEKIK